MKVRTPNNTNISSLLEPNTVYDAEWTVGDKAFRLKTHRNGSFTCCLPTGCAHLNGQDWIIVDEMPNRKKLADFIKVNNIKKTLVSLSIGHAENWLTTMVNEKRRGDLSDKAYALIMDKLHINWSEDRVYKVKATKKHTAYTTRTTSYKTIAHKARLQRAMWDGEVIF